MTAIRCGTVPGLINIHTAAYNDSASRLATCSADGKVNICDKSEDQQLWRLSSTLPTEGTQNSTKVAWAHSEHGSVIACASADGLISIWQQAQATPGQPGSWLQRATLPESTKPITSLVFAPRQLGPQLAAASEDGFVRFYEASAPLNANRWHLSNDFQASASSPAKCMSWRQHSHGLPPMLCVGTCQGASIWYYRSTMGDWVKAAALDTDGKDVTSIDWAPAVGRPVELIAAASSAGVCIWGLKGRAHDLQVHKMPCLSSDGQTTQDCLPSDGQVWKVQFDKMGSLLATSAVHGDSSSVCIWDLNSQGQWCLLRKITGEPDEPADDAGMLQ